MRAGRASKAIALSTVDVITKLTDTGDAIVPVLLPMADRHVAAFLDRCQTIGTAFDDHAIADSVEQIAKVYITAEDRGGMLATAVKETAAFIELGGGPHPDADLSDHVETATTLNMHAAFALGLATGLKIGGAR